MVCANRNLAAGSVDGRDNLRCLDIVVAVHHNRNLVCILCNPRTQAACRVRQFRLEHAGRHHQFAVKAADIVVKLNFKMAGCKLQRARKVCARAFDPSLEFCRQHAFRVHQFAVQPSVFAVQILIEPLVVRHSAATATVLFLAGPGNALPLFFARGVDRCLRTSAPYHVHRMHRRCDRVPVAGYRDDIPGLHRPVRERVRAHRMIRVHRVQPVINRLQ